MTWHHNNMNLTSALSRQAPELSAGCTVESGWEGRYMRLAVKRHEVFYMQMYSDTTEPKKSYRSCGRPTWLPWPGDLRATNSTSQLFKNIRSGAGPIRRITCRNRHILAALWAFSVIFICVSSDDLSFSWLLPARFLMPLTGWVYFCFTKCTGLTKEAKMMLVLWAWDNGGKNRVIDSDAVVAVGQIKNDFIKQAKTLKYTSPANHYTDTIFLSTNLYNTLAGNKK